jgi:hypothetical protein
MLATNNWIFLEELPAVNVIVHTLAGWYDVFRKRRYAILGETLSSGYRFVDGGEPSSRAAKRVALEELGLGSRWSLRTITEEIKGKGVYDNGRSTRNINSRDLTTLEMEDISKIIANIVNPLGNNITD